MNKVLLYFLVYFEKCSVSILFPLVLLLLFLFLLFLVLLLLLLLMLLLLVFDLMFAIDYMSPKANVGDTSEFIRTLD